MNRFVLAALLMVGCSCGCSSLLGRSNAGIPLLEGAPLGDAAVGAKYAGWIAGAPLDAVCAPLAALACATPLCDIADAADIFTLPSIGLGYCFEGLIGAPLY